jgi:hypothetical protein
VTDVDPERAVPRDPAEFVAAMRALKTASHAGFRTLEQRAEAVGDVLPKSTLVAVLGRETLPREEVVAAFVRACGLDEDAVDRWVAVRRGLADGGHADGLALPVDPPSAARVPPPVPAEPPPVVSPVTAGWLVNFVPPAIWRGSLPLRLVAGLLFGLVLLVTLAAVIGSIRDWITRS